ncbi:MAG TPA: SprT family zinc-dependent metalloprotease [Devosiaceae bacterium]
MGFFGQGRWPPSLEAPLQDGPVAVDVRVHPRARGYRLTVTSSGAARLTVPPHGRRREAEDFLRRHAGWLEARLARTPDRVPFDDGARVPLRGVDHVIVATGKLRGTVSIAGMGPEPALLVPGGPDHLARRLIDFLKREAKTDLEAQVAIHARTLGVRPTAIRLRDQSARWGSCASSGRLNFNWRLIMAPGFVLDYVAAHEVAHLVEMNHSPAFWAAVERALPDMKRGRAWLKANGGRLMAYGER